MMKIKAVKNIDYSLADYVKKDPEKLLDLFEAGMSMVVASTIALHCGGDGVQIRVRQDVSDELECADLDDSIPFDSLPWKAETMEFFFDNPSLPTVLVGWYSLDDLTEFFGREIFSPNSVACDESALRLITQTPDGKALFLYLGEEPLREFLKTGKTDRCSDGAVALDDDENYFLYEMLRLCVMTLLYADARGLDTVSKKQVKEGKPGIKSRPKTPMFYTCALPSRASASESAGEHMGEKKNFRGRCPCFRHLRSERFKHKRGQTIYVQGIPDPLTGLVPPRKTKTYIVK